MKKFIFDLQRFVDIYNEESNKLVSGTDGDDYIGNLTAARTLQLMAATVTTPFTMTVTWAART